VRCRGVRPFVGQRLEASAGLGDRVEDIEQVARGSSEPIQPCHHQHVSITDALEQLGQFGAVGLRAGYLLAVNSYPFMPSPTSPHSSPSVSDICFVFGSARRTDVRYALFGKTVIYEGQSHNLAGGHDG
jgi:hypothetical protein